MIDTRQDNGFLNINVGNLTLCGADLDNRQCGVRLTNETTGRVDHWTTGSEIPSVDAARTRGPQDARPAEGWVPTDFRGQVSSRPVGRAAGRLDEKRGGRGKQGMRGRVGGWTGGKGKLLPRREGARGG